MAIEKEANDTRNIWEQGVGKGKRKENQSSSSSSGKKQRTLASHEFQGQDHGYQGQGQVGASSQTKQMAYYHCHQLRHKRRDCLPREGSRNYGTPQSQSSLGCVEASLVSQTCRMG